MSIILIAAVGLGKVVIYLLFCGNMLTLFGLGISIILFSMLWRQRIVHRIWQLVAIVITMLCLTGSCITGQFVATLINKNSTYLWALIFS